MQEIEAKIRERLAQLGNVQYNLEVLQEQKSTLLKEISLLQQQLQTAQK